MYKDIVKNIEDVDPLVRMTLIDLSNSRIETLEGDWGCEAKYFYNYIIKEPDPGNPAALLGTVIHQVLENLLENEKPLVLEELMDEYNKQLYEYDAGKSISDELRIAGIVMIEDYYEANKDQVFSVGEFVGKKIHAKEMDFDIVIGRAKVRGYIDRVDITEDTVYIEDYKSGKHEYPTKHIHNNLQLGIYALATKMLYPDKNVHASLYYLRSGNKKGHLFTDSDLDRVVNTILDVTDKITNITTFRPTPKKWICNYCPHAASGACPSGSRAKK